MIKYLIKYSIKYLIGGRLAGGQGAAGDQYIRNLALPGKVMEDLARIRWAKVTEGLLKVEVWAEEDFLAAIPK